MSEIALGVKSKEDKLKIVVFSLVFVISLSLVIFTGGFYFAKSGQFSNILQPVPSATKSAAPSGWKVLDTQDFSIAYPEDWEAKENTEGEPTGATIKSEGGKIEFWLRLEKPYIFSDEQKKIQTGKKESKIKVDGREGNLTEITYDTGGYYQIIEVPATQTKPIATFQATAGNDDYKKIVLDIISSFKTRTQNAK